MIKKTHNKKLLKIKFAKYKHVKKLDKLYLFEIAKKLKNAIEFVMYYEHAKKTNEYRDLIEGENKNGNKEN